MKPTKYNNPSKYLQSADFSAEIHASVFLVEEYSTFKEKMERSSEAFHSELPFFKFYPLSVH